MSLITPWSKRELAIDLSLIRRGYVTQTFGEPLIRFRYSTH